MTDPRDELVNLVRRMRELQRQTFLEKDGMEHIEAIDAAAKLVDAWLREHDAREDSHALREAIDQSESAVPYEEFRQEP